MGITNKQNPKQMRENVLRSHENKVGLFGHNWCLLQSTDVLHNKNKSLQTKKKKKLEEEDEGFGMAQSDPNLNLCEVYLADLCLNKPAY